MLSWILMLALGANPEVRTVEKVDVTRYLGTWYEVASFPFFFQRGCHATTATYALRDDGDISVVNRCRKDGFSGPLSEVKGKAWVVDKTTNAKLKVQFFWPFSGNYWVLGLGPDYEYAVVGEPGRNHLWILSRTRQLSAELYSLAVNTAKSQGFDVSRLGRTPQPPVGDSD